MHHVDLRHNHEYTFKRFDRTAWRQREKLLLLSTFNLILKQSMKDVLTLLGSVVHELQKERACCCLFVGSDGEIFSQELRKQFVLTDGEVNQLETRLVQWRENKTLPPTSLKRLTDTRDKLIQHRQARRHILRLAWLPSEIIRVYSHDLIYPLVGVSIESALYDKSNNTRRVSAYANFLRWKEHTGRERAIGILGFLTHAFNNPQYVDWLKFQISEQESLKQTFINLTGAAQRHCLDRFIFDDAEKEVQKLHAIIESNKDSPSLQSMTAENWYYLLTQKIDLMLESERQLITTLNDNEHGDSPDGQFNPELSRVVKIHDQEDQFLRSLPLFNGVPEPVVDQLLKRKQVQLHKKGTILIQESQPSRHIYIILSGWVKLFKINSEGEESTLQMLSSGDIIGESQLLLNGACDDNAEIVVEAKVVTIPAESILQQVLSCHQLAVNMMKDISRFSQNILRLFQKTRLQTAEERTGWFLLKTVLDQGGIHQGEYQLPYNKSLIASFLDMRPETFSRALQRLKPSGMCFRKNGFQLLKPSALCQFCDLHNATSCRLRGTPDCYRPDYASRYSSDA